MDDLNPITRTERLLDGEDLTPTNREEMFIRRIYDKTQEIPEPVNRKEYFLKKAGEAGGDVIVVPLNVTENGTYSEAGKAYSPVTVEVEPPENSYQLKSITTPTSLATFEASAMPMPKLKASIVAKQASGTPSPSNPLPISGWDAANVTRTGKNLATESSGNNKVIGSVRKGYTYCFSLHNTGTIGFNLKKNNNSGDVVVSSGPASSDETISVTFTPDDNYNLFVNGYGSGGTTYGDNASNYQLELGSTATTYEPYINQTTTISLPQTVYGGELDVVNGILRITDGYIASYNGETLPSTWISSMDVYAEGTTPTTGAEVCYELATPTTVTLTPSLIKSLNGINNLSVDSGEVIEGEYFKALGGE